MNMTTQDQKQRELLSRAHHDFNKGLQTHAYFKLSNYRMSEDLVQDTFMKTWVYLMKGGEIDTMKAFLYHILNNLIIDEYRKSKTDSLDALLEKGFEPKTESTEQLINMLDGEDALVLISHLPVMYQKVMRMRYVQDLSLKEMSLITGQSRNTMAVQAHRGLEKLKILYEQKNGKNMANNKGILESTDSKTDKSKKK